MSEYVKQGMMGGYKTVPGGLNDPECTHVILTQDEYRELCTKIFQSDQKLKEAVAAERKDGERELLLAQNSHKIEIDRYRKHYTALIEKKQNEIRAEYAETQEKYEAQQGLVATLSRITRTQANQARKRKDKKGNCGYVVLNSKDIMAAYKTDRGETRRVKAWETTLQTPYSAQLTEPQVMLLIKELFQDDEDGDRIARKIGLDYKVNGYPEYIRNRKLQGSNVVFDQGQKRNFIGGYWELLLRHTKPLGEVPEEMMP